MDNKTSKIIAKLFTGDKTDHSNACLNFLPSMERGYTDGYLKAAETLVKHAVDRHVDLDYLVYPICYLYRHHIELILKEIIEKGRKLVLHEKNAVAKPVHSLNNLWNTALGVIKQRWPDDNYNELIKTTEVIMAIDAIDAKGDSFRYQRDRSGNQNLHGVTMINLSKLASTIKPVTDLLDSIMMAFDIEQDYLDQTE